MESTLHPNVDLFWNFFPITWYIWTPFRVFLNIIFFIPQFFAWPFEIVWNFIPESLFNLFNLIMAILVFWVFKPIIIME